MDPDEVSRRSVDLAARASTGDPQAIEQLLEEHLPAIEGFVRRHAGGFLRAQESVSDLAQSVCREVLERLRDGRIRFQGDTEFKRWLYRAAVMKMMSRRRFWQAERRDPAQARGRGADPALDSATREPFVDRATPSQDAILHEQIEHFARALAELDDDDRDMITLHHLEGLPHAEIAARKGISAAHSRVLLARALARLGDLGSRPGR